MTEHRIVVARTARYLTRGPDAPTLWFVLHGYGQLAADVLESCAVLDDGSRRIVAPEALSRFYSDRASRRVGASWMTRADRLAEIEDYVRYLDAVRRDVEGTVPAATVHVLGFSQGAATAARWVVRGAAPVDGLVLWGGELPPDLDLVGAAADRMRRATLTIVAGTADQYVTEKIVARDSARLDAAGIPHRMVRYVGGHSITPDVLRTVARS